jgi:hypothetical protein
LDIAIEAGVVFKDFLHVVVVVVETVLDMSRFNYFVSANFKPVAFIPKVTLITSYCDLNAVDMGKSTQTGIWRNLGGLLIIS